MSENNQSIIVGCMMESARYLEQAELLLNRLMKAGPLESLFEFNTSGAMITEGYCIEEALDRVKSSVAAIEVILHIARMEIGIKEE